MQEDTLRYADPAWLRWLCVGTAMLIAEKLLFIAWMAGRVILSVRWRTRFSIDIVTALLSFASLTGWWILSTPDPSGLGEETYGSARRMTRFASIVATAEMILRSVQQTLHLAPELDRILVLLIYAVAIIPIVGEVARWGYIAAIALRIPKDSLVETARWLRGASPVVASFAWLLSLVAWITTQSSNRSRSTLILFGCSGLLLLGAEGVLALIEFEFLRKLREKIKWQAKVASRNWDQASA
jgi:hypothetical protein